MGNSQSSASASCHWQDLHPSQFQSNFWGSRCYYLVLLGQQMVLSIKSQTFHVCLSLLFLHPTLELCPLHWNLLLWFFCQRPFSVSLVVSALCWKLVLFQHFLYDIYQTFVWWFSKAISLRIVSCRMAQSNVKFMAEVHHFLGSEGSSIFCYYLVWTAKSSQYIVFQKLNDYWVIFLSAWGGFNPLGEVVCCC